MTDGRALRKNGFRVVERGEMLVLLFWRMGYTDAAAAPRPGATRASSDNKAVENAPAACRHKSGGFTTGRALLASEHSTSTKEAFHMVRLKFG